MEDEVDRLISARILYVARKYGITVELFGPGNETPEDHKVPRDMKWGPQGSAGISFSRNLLYSYDSDHEIVFHELTHLVMGRPSVDVCEGFALLQFEWQLAKWVGRGLPLTARKLLRRGVDEYQQMTSIHARRSSLRDSGIEELLYEDRREAWWKLGLERARDMGVLNEKNQPTFRTADWSQINLRAAKRWNIQDEKEGRWRAA